MVGKVLWRLESTIIDGEIWRQQPSPCEDVYGIRGRLTHLVKEQSEFEGRNKEGRNLKSHHGHSYIIADIVSLAVMIAYGIFIALGSVVHGRNAAHEALPIAWQSSRSINRP
jgi:hypothetical protein